MKLYELRKSIESDALVEKEKLQKKIAKMKDEHYEALKERDEKISDLLSDCEALANRCHAMTLGCMCMYCELNEYQCPYAKSLDEKIAFAKAMRKKEN